MEYTEEILVQIEDRIRKIRYMLMDPGSNIYPGEYEAIMAEVLNNLSVISTLSSGHCVDLNRELGLDV